MTKSIVAGNVKIGGGARISVQSMTTRKTSDIAAVSKQIRELTELGCDIVRVAVPDLKSAEAIADIKKEITIPLVADVHFDYRLAVSAIEHGADKVRINPGNIGAPENIKAVAERAGTRGIPIRIGVNSGSIDKTTAQKYGYTPEAYVESALREVETLEKCGFYDICLSVKSSSVTDTVSAYKLLSSKTDYPLHIGVTEAGSEFSGLVKSSIGIGSLLLSGIGDTIRVSLTADPAHEVRAGIEILKALGLRSGPKLISCPTCARTEYDLIPIAKEVERRLTAYKNSDFTVAVMGCAVNGPGEAKHADFGIVGGIKEGLIFRKGETVAKVPENLLILRLFEIIDSAYK